LGGRDTRLVARVNQTKCRKRRGRACGFTADQIDDASFHFKQIESVERSDNGKGEIKSKERGKAGLFEFFQANRHQMTGPGRAAVSFMQHKDLISKTNKIYEN
jgi:hypothetical protein